MNNPCPTCHRYYSNMDDLCPICHMEERLEADYIKGAEIRREMGEVDE